MAVAYQSKSSATLTLGGSTQTISLPSGTTAGELLLIHYTQIGTVNSEQYLSVTGGTVVITGQVYHNADGYHSSGLWKKTVTSGDITNGYIEVSGSVSNINIRINVYRVSGEVATVDALEQIITVDDTPSYSVSRTPITQDSLLFIFAAASQSTGTPNGGSYAIATNNPTWTEITDERIENLGGSVDDPVMLAAHATRPEITATGNASLTFSNTTNAYSMGILCVVNPATNVSTSIDATAQITLTNPDISFVLDNTFSIDSAGSLTLNGPSHTVTAIEKTIWTDETKPNSLWTNESL